MSQRHPTPAYDDYGRPLSAPVIGEPSPDLAERVNQLAAAFRREVAHAYRVGAGRADEVTDLMQADAGLRPLTPALQALRAELGLPDPVLPSAQEHGELSRRLYTGRGPGTASGPAAGG